MLPRLNVCYIYQKQGVQGFKILYWLSSCDDKNKDKVKDKDKDKDKAQCMLFSIQKQGVQGFKIFKKQRQRQIFIHF